MKNYLLIIAMVHLLSCGGGGNDKKITTKPTPFSVSIEYINEAVAKQPITITLSSSDGNSIAISEFTTDSELSINITKVSESEYQLMVPELFLPQSLAFQINATANTGATVTSNGTIEYDLNHYPTFTDYVLPETAEELSTITVELLAEDPDGHEIVDISLSASNENTSISKLSENSFSVTLPDVEYSQSIYFKATATDEFQSSTTSNNIYINVVNEEPYFEISGLTGVLTNSTEYYYVWTKDLPDDVTVTDVKWSQAAGPKVTIKSANEESTLIDFPSTQEKENIQIFATITLSNDDVHVVTQNITTIKNLTANAIAIDSNVAGELINESRKSPELDINEDGLSDLVTIEEGIVYVEYQNINGSHQDRIEISKITFHQWLSDYYSPNDLDTLRSHSEIKVVDLRDMNNDGLLDLVINGRIVWPEYAYSENVAGWIAGNSNNTKFHGDYISRGFEGSSHASFEDINFDGIPDWIEYNLLVFVYGPYVKQGSIEGFSDTWDSQEETKIVHFDTQIQNQGTFFGDLYGDGERDMLTLVSTNQEWESGGKSWIKIHTLNNETKTFNQDVSIYLDTKATRIYLIDVTDDGIDDILYYDAQSKNYMVIDNIE